MTFLLLPRYFSTFSFIEAFEGIELADPERLYEHYPFWFALSVVFFFLRRRTFSFFLEKHEICFINLRKEPKKGRGRRG